MTDRLAHDAVDAALVVMPEWERADRVIAATYAMPTFPIGILLVDRAAELAEAANHHPDINVRWRRVTFLLTTHDSGGLTTRDLSLAEGIHAAALALGWDPAA